MQPILFQSQVVSLEGLARGQKAAEADPHTRLQTQLCVQWALYHRMRGVLQLVMAAGFPCLNSLSFWQNYPAEKTNSKLWIWMSWVSTLPSLQSLYIGLSPSKKGQLVKLIFQFKVQGLGLRAPGFWFRFPMASRLQFSLSIDLSSGRASSPFSVCPAGYPCSENRPRTKLWCWGQAGQPALPPRG